MTGAVTARGEELMRPVSFLTAKEKVVEIFQRLENGAIQAFPVKPIVTILPASDEKSYDSRRSPNVQSSWTLKLVHI